jgi:hypothetical protein
LAKDPSEHRELQESVQIDTAKGTLIQTLSLDDAAEEIKSGSSTEVLPCPPDVASPNSPKPKSKLSDMRC